MAFDYTVINGNTQIQIDGQGTEPNAIVIPPTITDGTYGELPVVAIGVQAFDILTPVITSLNLAGATNLLTIGIQAFRGCNTLVGAVTIPASVTSIGRSAFYQVTLSSLDLSGATSLLTIGQEAFYQCGSLGGTVVIPANVTSIGIGAFRDSTVAGLDLTGATNQTEILDYAFRECSSLTSVDFSGATSLLTIEQEAFYLCTTLGGNITIPASMTSIVDYAFGSTAIISLDLSGATNLVTIAEGAFRSCTSLAGTLTIPANVTSIGFRTFDNCPVLTGTITIPSSVTSIGEDAFRGCSGLDAAPVTFLGDAPAAGPDVFQNATPTTGTYYTGTTGWGEPPVTWSDISMTEINRPVPADKTTYHNG
jgi:hypothetical protein